jgi:hypothetical protein
MQHILAMVQQFWQLILDFDGTTKFLALILSISQAINALEEHYSHCRAKYDEEAHNFSYLIDLFHTLILNRPAEEDELLLTDAPTFLITAGPTLLHANNQFALLVNQELSRLQGSSYYAFIPEVYREPHKLWAEEFVDRSADYEDVPLTKCFAQGPFEMRQVRMTHRILPRFMEGLEIYTKVDSLETRDTSDSFLVLAEREALYIKNIEPSFYELTRFKVNQRNVKLLEELSLCSIFESINTQVNPHTLQETSLLSSFLDEFTYFKTRTTKAIGKASKNSTTNIKKKAEDDELVFTYEVLKNAREEDPFLKIRFRLKAQGRPEEHGEASQKQQEATGGQEVAS